MFEPIYWPNSFFGISTLRSYNLMAKCHFYSHHYIFKKLQLDGKFLFLISEMGMYQKMFDCSFLFCFIEYYLSIYTLLFLLGVPNIITIVI